MMTFLQHIAEIGSPRGRLTALLLGFVLILWTAGAQALSPPPGTPIINQATAQYRDANGTGDAAGNPLYATSNTITILLSGAAQLNITANAVPNPVAPGETLTYTIVIENTGNITANAVTASAILSSHLEFQGASSDGISAPPAVTWTPGNIAPGGSVTLNVTARLAAGVAGGTDLPFSITAVSADGPNDTETLTTKAGSAANLSITDSASVASTIPGGEIEYTIHYGNIGNLAATNVIISNNLPAGTSLIAGSITGGGTVSGATITWTPGTVQPGVSGAVHFKVRVSSTAAAGDVISNSSSIISSQTTAVFSNTLLIPVVIPPMVPPTVTKQFAPDMIIINGSSSMTITIDNPNVLAVTGVAFTDTYPSANMKNAAAAPATNTCGGTVAMTSGGSSFALSGGVIPASGSCTIVVPVTATAQGTYTNSTGPIATANAGTSTAASATLSVVNAPLATNTFSPNIIAVSGTATMTITINNPLTSAVTGVAFTDTYPSANMKNAAAAPATNTCGGTVAMTSGGSSFALSGGVIPASGSCTIVVPVTATAQGTYTNSTGPIATANAGTIASASATLTVLGTPSATKSFSGSSVTTNELFQMTITLANPNVLAVTGVAFTDTYPSANMKNAAAAPATNTCGGTVAMTSGGSSFALSGGVIPASGSCTIVVPVTATAVGTYTNSTGPIATANAGTIASASATVTASIPVNASLLFTQSAPSTRVSPGSEVVYTFTLTNNGNVGVTGVTIENQLPPEVTFVSSDAASTLTNGRLIVNIGNMTPGAVRTVHVTVTVNPEGTAGKNIVNTASVTSVEAQQKTASATVLVGIPLLSIVKTATTAVARPGNELSYDIALANQSDVPVLNITLRDVLPAGVVFSSADSGGTENNGTVNWSIPSLDPGRTVTLHLTVTLDKAFHAPSISNTVRVTASGMNERQSTAVKNITPRTAGDVAFFDATWQPAYAYTSGSTIYIQVSDADQNLDPTVAETVRVVLTPTDKDNVVINGDTETVLLTETGPDTGIFRGSIGTTASATDSENGVITVVKHSRIQATYTDPLDAVPVKSVSALIDPAGIVFNSITGNPVTGAVVTLRNWDNVTNTCDLTSWPALPPGQINPATTGEDGRFAFPLVAVGDYCFQVTPPANYTFPSAVADADLPDGFIIGDASRGGKFSLRIGDPPLINDIPVDPPIGRLNITKTANKTSASIGELIVYTLKVENKGEAPVKAIAVSDVMPHGIAYVKKSSLIGGRTVDDPKAPGSRTFTWALADLDPGKWSEISYRAVVGPDTKKGDAINTASGTGTSIGKNIVSNNASFKIKITEGVFTTKGTIIGRVFIDRDGNGLPRKDTGVPNVALYLEDGTRVVTDKDGKFSISGVVAGTHVLRLDETTLEKGLLPKPISNRFMNNGYSLFVDMTQSGLFKANFALDKTADYSEPPVNQEKKPEAPETGGVTPSESVTPDATNRDAEAINPDKSEIIDNDNQGVPPASSVSETSGTKETGAPADASVSASTASGETVEPSGVKESGPVDETLAEPAPTGIEALRPAAEQNEKISEETNEQDTGSTASQTPPAIERVEEIPGAAEQPEQQSPVPAAEAAEASEAAEPGPIREGAELPLTEQILTMTPELEILKPLDQSVSTHNSTRVLVKFPMDTVLTLTVDGETVSDSQIGTKIRNEKGRIVIHEFVDVRLKPGEDNLIRAEVKDAFGISRGIRQVLVSVVGQPEKIILQADQKEAAADGQSRINVTVSVVDKNGRAVTDYQTVTASVTAGDILEKDVDLSRDGHQVTCQNGMARFTIVAPRETGPAAIQAEVSDLIAEADIFFTPDTRPMFIVGLGEIVLGKGHSSGDLSYLKDRRFFSDGTYFDGRGAVFLKGNFYRDFVLTAAYDSNKERTDELFRESDTRLDSEEKYPVYGDESKTGYEALSRENLYVKLEKGKSYLLYGDYRTDLTDTKLSAYTRSFNGLKFEVNTDRFKLRSFGSYTEQTQVVDTVPGKGISGFYYLTGNDIIEGSERVVIETRDRLQPDRILNRETKTRGSDYDIDYTMGTLLFKEPIPSHNAEGNPLYIITMYESIRGEKKYYVYGGRGAYKVSPWLEIGATGIVEENAVSDSCILGADMTFTLPFNTLIKAEYVNTRDLFDINGMLVPQTGNGFALDAKSQPLEKLILNGYFRILSDFFSNPSASDAIRGTQKWGLDAAYEIMPGLAVKAKYLDEEDKINDSSRMLASAGIAKKFTKTTISAEISRETSENLTPTPAQILPTPGGLLNGVPFLNAYEIPDKATFLTLALERELLPNLSLSLSYKKDFGEENLSVTQAGLNYKLNQQIRLYVREEYAKYRDSKQTRTLIGVESQILKNTTLYNEYRLAGGAAGERNQQVIGLKNKFHIMEGLTANVASEYLSTISGQKNENEPDAFAVAGSLEYLPKNDFKITGRLEHRNEIEGEKRSYLAEIAAVYKINPDYSLLLRERYFVEENGDNDNHTSRLLAGLSYRPLDNDRLNALGKLEYKYNRQSSSQPGYTTNAFILSMEGIYQLMPRIQLMGKYAGKLERDDKFTSYTDLVAARILYDISDRFDFGVEYRLLTSYLIDTRLHGGAAELGCRLIDQLWLSLGYSFDRFDDDLTGDGYEGEGPYLKLRFKFDENIFSKRKR
jgi:uncharacterized repeat protein (TIGR01451 family)